MRELRPVAADAPLAERLRGLWQAVLELSKARLSTMVVITTAVGFILGSPTWLGIDWQKLVWTCVGTFLAAIGASAFNQCWEVQRDAKMKRTRGRPIPAGIISRRSAFAFAFFVSSAGVAILCPTSNWMTAILGLANVLLYVLVYTPLKPVTSFNTIVGAVVGALPPLMGWVAASGSISKAGLVLAGILLVWQIPHFLALAWMYKDDYAKGGFRMLPAFDESGRLTARVSLVWSIALIPLGLWLTMLGITGMTFAVISCVLGCGMVILVGRFALERSRDRARQVFLASIVYLPVLLMAMVLNRV